MKKLVFVTSNENKAREVRAILGIDIQRLNLDLHGLQEMDLEKIIEHKVREAYKKIRKPVLVEDVGLYIDAWNGFPGPFIKWLHGTMGYKIFPTLLPKSNRRAEWVVEYGYFDGKKFRSFIGRLKGAIAQIQKGKDGWGFDTLFVPKGYQKTFAELGGSVKYTISARKKALMKLKKFLSTK